MPAYHSSFTNNTATIGNLALLPIKTHFRGPAPTLNGDELDIIDEALYFFRANVFFRTYEIKSDADRVLIYITLYITECLKKLQKCGNQNQALNELYSLALAKFDIPGDPDFPLNLVYAKPSNITEAGSLRSLYFPIASTPAHHFVLSGSKNTCGFDENILIATLVLHFRNLVYISFKNKTMQRKMEKQYKK
ncbi:actin-related protein 2/3 complex subunit 3-like isoform X2 [Belonocnema kinseyi]|nr:actin-related protein 2/3 complex subunit 3-like isoform X2 [Belonocnema kinseyi]